VATCAVAVEALAIWSSEAPDEKQQKIALQLPKQDFYSFKLCTVDKVHAVRPVDNNNDMPFPSQKFNSLNVRSGGPLGQWTTRLSSLNPPLFISLKVMVYTDESVQCLGSFTDDALPSSVNGPQTDMGWVHPWVGLGLNDTVTGWVQRQRRM